MEKLFKKIMTIKNIDETRAVDLLKKFEVYYFELIEANKKFNLTSIEEKEEVEIKHFIDSIEAEGLIKDNSKIIDIGTGAGFPGMALSIVKEKCEFYLIDSLKKRTNFLIDLSKKLDLKNVKIFHKRAEDLEKNYLFDYAVSRAVAPLNVLCEYCLPFVKVNGCFIAYKGSNYLSELENAKNAIKVLGGRVEKIINYDLYINDEKNERVLIIIKKVSDTDKKYPRSQNKPRINPL